MAVALHCAMAVLYLACVCVCAVAAVLSCISTLWTCCCCWWCFSNGIVLLAWCEYAFLPTASLWEALSITTLNALIQMQQHVHAAIGALNKKSFILMGHKVYVHEIANDGVNEKLFRLNGTETQRKNSALHFYRSAIAAVTGSLLHSIDRWCLYFQPILCFFFWWYFTNATILNSTIT